MALPCLIPAILIGPWLSIYERQVFIVPLILLNSLTIALIMGNKKLKALDFPLAGKLSRYALATFCTHYCITFFLIGYMRRVDCELSLMSRVGIVAGATAAALGVAVFVERIVSSARKLVKQHFLVADFGAKRRERPID